MAIEEEAHVEATTPTNGEAATAPESVETSSRSDPVEEPAHKSRSKLNETIRSEFDKAKREPSAARQAAAAQRAREETGKFAPGTKDPSQVSAPVEQPVKAAPDATQVPPKNQQSEPVKAPQSPTAAPASLSKETRAIWDTLPDVVKADIVKRESDTAKGVEQLKSRYQPIDEALAPYRPLLQQYGKTEAEAIKQLFFWQQALASPNPQAKAQAFQALARSHGFDLSTLAPQASGQQQQQDPNDPRIAIQQALQGSLAPIEQRLTAWEQRLQHEQQSKVQNDIGEFSKDKPHFDKVRNAMGQMMAAGYATSLDDAYNKATWADPEIRADILAAENAKREADTKAAQEAAQAKAVEVEAERRRKEREAAEKARKANVSPRAGTPAGSVSPKAKSGKSVKDSVADTIRELSRASI